MRYSLFSACFLCKEERKETITKAENDLAEKAENITRCCSSSVYWHRTRYHAGQSDARNHNAGEHSNEEPWVAWTAVESCLAEDDVEVIKQLLGVRQAEEGLDGWWQARGRMEHRLHQAGHSWHQKLQPSGPTLKY